MPENYDHYISKNIKAFYKRRLAAPIIYLIVLILAWHFFSLSAVFSPDILPDDTSLETAFRGGKQYISTTLSDLKFTGYTQSIFGHTNGYYYYTMRDEECIIVLLSPNTSEEGLPSIEEVTIKGKISKGNENFDTLLSNLSTDLNWTENGIRNKVSSYYISEPGFNHVGNWILFAAIFITGIYALLCIVLSVIYMFFPVLSPACQDLALFGNPKKMLEQAEEELATLPQLATEDMFITEHFFIETSVYGNAIVPIDEIIWIYKYSTLHKFFWYHFSIRTRRFILIRRSYPMKTILVLFGGCSTEYEVSLHSAYAVLSHMDPARYTPLAVGITREGQWLCYTGDLSRLEDGTWQQAADCIPCTPLVEREAHALLLLLSLIHI